MNNYIEKYSIKDISEDIGFLYKLYIENDQIKYIHEIGEISKTSIEVMNQYPILYHRKKAYIPFDIKFN